MGEAKSSLQVGYWNLMRWVQ